MGGNGHVLPNTPIAIDMWDLKSHPQARIFFLTHFHGDHIVGLTNSWQYPIYASPITCKLLAERIKVQPELLRSLEVGQDHIIPIDLEEQETITVTLFDANHCPGSVMLLLSGYFGDVLYTGDFRYKPDMFDGFQLPPIDVLYLDNTYCSPKCIFPSRENAAERILSQLHTCLVQCDRVFLGMDNLGKEDLLIQIAKETHCKIFIKSNKKSIMDVLGLSNIISSDEANSRILVVPTNQISGKNITQWNKEKKTHAILTTARFCGFSFQPFSKYPEIHIVPYSNHSSYSELKKFIKEIKPSTIVPIVGKNAKGIFGIDISDRADMSVFDEFLNRNIPSHPTIPESVKRTMNVQEQLSSLPLKKRKIARKIVKRWHKPPTVGIRYIVSEDSETDSDPEAIHFEPKISIPAKSEEGISEYSSSDNDGSEESDSAWEIVCSSGYNAACVSQVN